MSSSLSNAAKMTIHLNHFWSYGLLSEGSTVFPFFCDDPSLQLNQALSTGLQCAAAMTKYLPSSKGFILVPCLFIYYYYLFQKGKKWLLTQNLSSKHAAEVTMMSSEGRTQSSIIMT